MCYSLKFKQKFVEYEMKIEFYYAYVEYSKE